MLTYLIPLVAGIVGITVLIGSGGVDAKAGAQLQGRAQMAAVSPQMLKLQAQTNQCLEEGRPGCITAQMAALPGAAARAFPLPTWANAQALFGVARGCASGFSASALREWTLVQAPTCPGHAYTAYFALPLDTSQADPMALPFPLPASWWANSASPLINDQFSGVAVLATPGKGSQAVYLWAKTYLP